MDIPQDVWEAVRKLATAHQRSFVKELVWALQEYVKHDRYERRDRRTSRHASAGDEG